MGEESWRVKLWGVRGSFPSPGADFLEYGGNTACISVDCGDALVVLDGGSGLAALGDELVQEKRRRVDILFSHLHLDHVMGLFPFAPRYDPTADIHLYGRPGLAEELIRLMGASFWPVDLSSGRAQVYFHAVETDVPFPLADGAAQGLTVTALEGNHPGGCLYYRLERHGTSLVYALDCELSDDMVRRLGAFARGTDLLIWDASFIPGALEKGWGHSTWEEGAAFGRAAGAKRVLMTHYSRSDTDQILREQERMASQADRRVQFAREGMVIAL